MCTMCSLSTKSYEDVEIQGRSKAQKTDDKNDTAPQTQPGTALPNWAEEKPFLAFTCPKVPAPGQPSPLH